MGIERDLLREIEHLRRVNRKLEEARAAAEAARQATADHLAMLSHAIRNPVSAVIGTLDLLLDTGLSSQQGELASRARSNAHGMLGILNDVLDLARSESGRMAIEEVDFNLRRVVDEVAEQHAASARLRGIELIVRYPRGLPETFLGDPGRIRQVLVNLVGNAVKFTASGHVLIDVASALGRAVRIEVQDTGIGIPAEQLERVFERYTQANASTARRYGGSGLGLSISRQLVELMGGTISVRSTEGVGSTFSLVLPLKRTVAPDPATLTGMRVLVAEDNESNQLVASHLLSRAGCRVEVAGNGVEVLRKLEEQPYDLVLMDCHMPELDGYETATAIRRSDAPWGGVRIVAVTASAMADDRDLCLASGMDGYVSKPLRVDEVRGAVKRGRARSPSSRTGVGGARGSEGAPRCSR